MKHEEFTPEYGIVRSAFVSIDDLDASGAVHNARYPLILERVVVAHWYERGWRLDPRQSRIPDVLQVAREFTISYQFPIFGLGEVKVHLWIEKAGRTSFTYGFAFLSADGSVTHATGHRVQVRLDPATLQSTPLSPEGIAELVPLAKPGVLTGQVEN